ncbi:MAG TPA: lyase family protein [Streptosporangiaceae bacterium]|nr:lyase family protein [Streptosporangiaceae bacterium]
MGYSIFGGLFDRGPGISDDAWLQAMLDTEAALARAAERAGLAPPGTGAAVTSVADVGHFRGVDLPAAARATGNPVPALVKALTALAPPDAAIHLGATSQDIIDTAAMLIARRSIDAVLADLSAAGQRCVALTRAHAGTVMAGRTLLQQAVPITFGLVTANWLTAIDEARTQLHRVRTSRLAIQYGGAAGTLAPLGEAGPAVADLVAEELGLPAPALPWHTNRLRILDLAAALTATCAALGKIARDVTLLSQTEVAEVHEATGGGSSTMPHKQNPVAAVVILGHTKQAPHLLATLASAAEQEHQRGAGSWHSEWQPLTHLLALTTSSAAWAADLLGGLQVDEPRMRANLEATHGLTQSEHITTLLTPHLGRQKAHALVSQATARAAAGNITLAEALTTSKESSATLAACQITRDQLDVALAPTSYLGATAQFISRALAAHESHSSVT